MSREVADRRGGQVMGSNENAAVSHLAGKYLTFVINGENYGVEILRVQEIIAMIPVTDVPKTPDYVRGIINLRGKVIPVIDLRCKFGLPEQEDTDRTCIIVVQIGSGASTVVAGTIVDEVSEVMDIEAGQIEPSPSFGSAVDTDFILGMGKADSRVIMLLDIERVMEGATLPE